MITTKYFVFPAGKPEEKFEVLPHTAGEGEFSFAKKEASETGNLNDWYEATPLYTFANPDQDGAFVNNDIAQLDVTGEYDIMKEEVEA